MELRETVEYIPCMDCTRPQCYGATAKLQQIRAKSLYDYCTMDPIARAMIQTKVSPQNEKIEMKGAKITIFASMKSTFL